MTRPCTCKKDHPKNYQKLPAESHFEDCGMLTTVEEDTILMELDVVQTKLHKARTAVEAVFDPGITRRLAKERERNLITRHIWPLLFACASLDKAVCTELLPRKKR